MADTQQQQDFSTWTPCEEYGHNYVADEEDSHVVTCTDCGDRYTI